VLREALVSYRTTEGNMSSNIRLLETDTFAVLDKFFRLPEAAAYLPLRRRVYSRHWLVCAGSYLHKRDVANSLRCFWRGVVLYPPYVRRVLGAPWRWLVRLARLVNPAQ
jgi:hypothetical protein